MFLCVVKFFEYNIFNYDKCSYNYQKLLIFIGKKFLNQKSTLVYLSTRVLF